MSNTYLIAHARDNRRIPICCQPGDWLQCERARWSYECNHIVTKMHVGRQTGCSGTRARWITIDFIPKKQKGLSNLSRNANRVHVDSAVGREFQFSFVCVKCALCTGASSNQWIKFHLFQIGSVPCHGNAYNLAYEMCPKSGIQFAHNWLRISIFLLSHSRHAIRWQQ